MRSNDLGSRLSRRNELMFIELSHGKQYRQMEKQKSNNQTNEKLRQMKGTITSSEHIKYQIVPEVCTHCMTCRKLKIIRKYVAFFNETFFKFQVSFIFTCFRRSVAGEKFDSVSTIITDQLHPSLHPSICHYHY